MSFALSFLCGQSTFSPALYYTFVAAVYGIIAVIFAFVLIFGLRAKRNVKHEKITRMPDGFSPLDVKRIFIGKTYPQRLTRALIAYWGERGYIKVKQLSRNTVRIIKLKGMPKHDSDDALFFDRGTYVRENALFQLLIKRTRNGKPVNLNRAIFTKDDARLMRDYAVREDEGVYSAKHYTLKIVTIALCIFAALLAQVYKVIAAPENFIGIVGVGFACIGLAVLMFVKEMPIVFKTIWCGGVACGLNRRHVRGNFVDARPARLVCYRNRAFVRRSAVLGSVCGLPRKEQPFRLFRPCQLPQIFAVCARRGTAFARLLQGFAHALRIPH